MLSSVIRRTHMYLALFLSPWVLTYALSTIVMNHRYSTPSFEKEQEQSYEAAFPAGAQPRQMAGQILSDLRLEGAFNVQPPASDGRLTILRQDLLSPKRITYTPAERKLVVERQAFQAASFLGRFHRRRGYQQPYALDDTWAVTVDLFIAAMIFWVLSGLWMWWEMRVTRLWGGVFALAGAGLFAFFLVTI